MTSTPSATKGCQDTPPDPLSTPPPSVKKPTLSAATPPPQPPYTWTQATKTAKRMQELLTSMGHYQTSLAAIQVEPNMFTKGVPGLYNNQRQYWNMHLEREVQAMHYYLAALGETCSRFQKELPHLQQMQKFIAYENKEAKAHSTLDMSSMESEIGPGLAKLKDMQGRREFPKLGKA